MTDEQYDMTTAELLVFAIIYGFTRKAEGKCVASAEYIAQWARLRPRQVYNVLHCLETKGYISKCSVRINNTNRCEYVATLDHHAKITECPDTILQKLHNDTAKFAECNMQNLHDAHTAKFACNINSNSSRIEEKESSCSCSARVREDDNNDNNNDQSEYNISHNDGRKPRPMYRVNRTGIDESQLPYLDYVEWFMESHPKVRLYDNMGFFYKNGKQFRMSEYQTWPKILYEHVHLMFKGYSQVENYISGIAEAFGQDIERVKELFPIWCQWYGLDKVCYDIPDLYEKRSQFSGTTLNNAARSFFRQPAKEQIPSIAAG